MGELACNSVVAINELGEIAGVSTNHAVLWKPLAGGGYAIQDLGSHPFYPKPEACLQAPFPTREYVDEDIPDPEHSSLIGKSGK